MKRMLMLMFGVLTVCGLTYGETGKCGQDIEWSLSGGYLSIWGIDPTPDERVVDHPMGGAFTSVKQTGYIGSGNWSFYRSKVKSVSIAEGVTEIGPRAFLDHVYLNSISIPSTMLRIRDYAFAGCESLTSINLPYNCYELGDGVFHGCKKMSTISVPHNHQFFYVIGGVLYARPNNNGYKEIQYVKYCPPELFKNGENVEIWRYATRIDNYAFYGCSGIGSVNIPDTVDSIGNYAFYGCSELRKIHLPNSITAIRSNAFEDCKNLEWILIPSSVKQIGSSVFAGCSSLKIACFHHDTKFTYYDNAFPESTSILRWKIDNGTLFISGKGAMKLPNNIEYPWSYASNNIYNVVIDNGITDIGRVFSGYKNLKSVTIPNSVTNIEDYAFGHCTALTKVLIPNTVLNIGYGAFIGCGSLTNVTLSSVMSIGAAAFYQCTNLVNVSIGNNVTNIGFCAFEGCYSMSELSIPDSVQYIGPSAFAGCESLKGDIVIPKGVEVIEKHTFNSCRSIESVIIPNNTVFLGEQAFSYCASLKNVTIGKSVTNICDSAFLGCDKLKKLVIPNSVTKIGYRAFKCASLTNVVCIGEKPDDQNRVVFESVAPACVVVVSPEYESWSSAIKSGTWQGMKVIPAKSDGGPYVENVNDLEWTFSVIDRRASIGCCDSNLNASDVTIKGDLVVPDVLGGRIVSCIGDGAFADCKELESIYIPETVLFIGDKAFKNCSSLKKIYIPEQLKGNIHRTTFDGCSADLKIVYYSEESENEELWWTKIPLDSNGGFLDVNYALEVEGFPVSNLPRPSRTGCLFLGWFTEKAGGDKITSETIVTADMKDDTLYAHYQEVPKLLHQVLPIDRKKLESEGYIVITNAESFIQTISTNLQAKVALGANIDFNGVEYGPIGTWENPFEGVFEGNGYGIKNLTINKKDLDYVGIFGAVDGGIIGNVWIENVNVVGKDNVGVLAGRTYWADVSNVSVIGASVKGAESTGGLVGELDSSEVSDGQVVSIDVEGNNDVGGAFGCCLKSNVRSVEMNGDRVHGVANVGGFTGRNLSSTIEDCGVNVKILGNENVGGFSGYSYMTTIERCQVSGKIENEPVNVGGFCGQFVGSSVSSVISASIWDTTCGITNGVGFYASSDLVQTSTMKGIASWHVEGDYLLGRGDGGAEVHGYYGVNQNVVIPQYIAGEKVVSIGERAFSTFSDIAVESVEIHDGVKRIDSKAFEDCPAKSIILPNSVTSIGEYAFRHCGSLTSMPIPSRINNIPKGAFVGCESLTDITLPSGLKEICDSVFYGCSSIDGISIPSSVTNIGEYAFAECMALSTMEIPSSVTVISDEMFRNCSNLRAVTLHEGIIKIGDSAFYGCSSLEQIAIPDGVEDIGKGAFSGCVKLADADGCVVVRSKIYDYFGDPETLRIPDAVTEIEEGVFDRFKDLKELDLPFSDVMLSKMFPFVYQNITNVVIRNSAVAIGPSFFRGCIALENVDIPSSVTNIADSSFIDCRNLSHVTIPVSVRDIGSSAFYGCSKLKSIRFLGDIARVGGNAFYGCDSLSEVHLSDLSSWCGVLFRNNYANPIQKAGCFYLNDALVNDLTIPDDVIRIGAYAFAGCRELNSVTIPVGVENIGSSAFSGCTGLKSVTMPQIVCDSTFSKIFPDSYSKIRKVEFLDDVTSIGANLFLGCASLSDITIPEGVTQIGASAFAGCTGLTSVTIPQIVCDSTLSKVFPDSYSNITKVVFLDNVTRIGANLFSGCASLSDVIIPDRIVNIGDGAFKGCGLLADKDGFVVYKGVLYDYLGSSADVTLPSTVTKVSPYSFKGCSGVISVVVPETLANVGAYAFSGCDSLVTVEMLDGVKDIGDHSFSSCRGLKSVSIPDSITNVCENAFDGCSSLSSAVISKYVIDRTVRNMFPSVHMNLKEISVLDGVTKIGDSAFSGCSSLERVIIPVSVIKIEDNAFYGCRKLTYASIPSGVESIGKYVFYDCLSMTEISIPDSVAYIGNYAFKGCGNLAKVRVSQCVLDRTVKEVFPSAYGNLREIEVSDDVTNIGSKAFYGCESLEEIIIPCNVTSIGDSAFYKCSSLKDIELPEGLTNVGKDAFYGCTGLFSDGYFMLNSILYSYIGAAADITIPNGVTKVADYAVYGRKTLKSVTVPSAVEYLGRYAFAENTALTNITFLGDAPSVEATTFTNLTANCTVYVSLFSSGWDVDIPGIWNGLSIRHFNHAVTFDLGEHGVRVGGGELKQIVDNGSAAVEPIIEIEDGWVFNGWSASFSNITKSLTINALYKRKPVVIDGVSWTYDILVDGGIVIGNGTEPAVDTSTTETLKIPSAIGGKPVTCIANKAFDGCSQLSSVEIPSTIRTIGSYAFANCRNLVRITLPDGMRTLPVGVFSGCTLLEEVVMPESIIRILGSAFANCRNLKNINLPSNLASIGDSCFSGCRKLDRIEIPASVIEIGSLAFGKCTSLTNVTFMGNAPTVKGSYIASGHPALTVWVSRLSSGWNVDIPGVWKGALIRYSNHYVTFLLDDWGVRTGGGELSQLVNDGEYAVLPEVQAVEGWIFDGWDQDTSTPITNNIEFIAVYVKEPVVSINGREFGTIHEALDFAMDGQTIKLLTDIDLEIPIEIYDGRNITIDLNGRKLLMTSGEDICIYNECGDLTIDDSVGGGCVVGDVVSSGGFIWLKNGRYEGYCYADDLMGGGMLVTGGMFKYSVEEWYLGYGLMCKPTDDGDMFVIMERPVHKATFDIGEHGRHIGGGGLVQAVENGGVAEIPEVEAENGWIFIGWLPNATEPLFQDTAFVAQYEPRMCSVTFDLGEYGKHVGGGELMQLVQAGQLVEVPDISVLNGWEFVGWSPGVTKPISDDVVFVAQYVELPPSREFEIDAVEWVKPLTVTVGEKIRFNYDLSEIDESNWGMCEGASYCAIVCDSDGNILSELKYDTVPNVGYFDWTVSADCPEHCLVGVIPVEVWREWEENPTDIINGFDVTVQRNDLEEDESDIEIEKILITDGFITNQSIVLRMSIDLKDEGLLSDCRDMLLESNLVYAEYACSSDLTSWTSNYSTQIDSVTVDDGKVNLTVTVSFHEMTTAQLSRQLRMIRGVVKMKDIAVTTLNTASIYYSSRTVVVNKVIETYTVTFVPGIGAHIGGGELVQMVEEGCSAIEPTMAYGPFDGWCFVGWDRDDWQCVSEDITVNAVYEYVPIRHFVLFDIGAHGTHISGPLEQYVLDGEYAIVPEIEAHEGWTFAGWSRNVDAPICGETTFVALYEQINTALPVLGDGATSADVKLILKNAVDVALTNVNDVTLYNSFREWADDVKNSEGMAVGAQAVKKSDFAWLSFALNTDKLITNEIVSSDMAITSFGSTAKAGDFNLEVSLKDIHIGAGSVDEATMKENLRKIFVIEGATSLNASNEGGGMSEANVDVVFGATEDGKVKFTVIPKAAGDEKPNSFFFRVKMK